MQKLSLSIAIATALCLVSPAASAQVTLNLTTQDGNPCVVLTNTQGIRSSPDSTALWAKPVVWSGSGCTEGGENGSTTLAAPATVATGSLALVQWTAPANATTCVYAGTLPSGGLVGWPIGEVACAGSPCAGTHATTVQPGTAGTYVLRVVCSDATGVAHATTTATPVQQPPQPPNFPLSAPSSATVGDTITVQWSVTGATTCVGTATRDGVSTALTGWTDSTAPTPPRSIPFTQQGTYVLRMTCSNAYGSTTSASRTIAVAPNGGGGGCPAGRQTTANVCYHYNLGTSQCSPGTDVTTFDTIWGRGAPNDTPQPFPGRQGYAIFKDFQKSNYIAAQFTVPMSGATTGKFFRGETLPGPGVTMSISSTCGDFSQTTPCQRAQSVPGTELVRWKMASDPNYGCPLTPGGTYYVNLKVTDPNAGHTDCSGSTCIITIQNNYNVGN